MFWSLLNGERTVVVLFIAPVLFAAPLSLLSEALSFSLLTLFAALIEIFAESSDSLAQFKTRGFIWDSTWGGYSAQSYDLEVDTAFESSVIT
ncbi:hypothetical protein Acr_23g0012080 [Actinidia rufa]|uniref:Uncharacterized protein n=1 Tax=Actinidia rufa TaxID=165716 RepID=A0A7J0GPV7_9ERIC|nr:hypothetical protein Acr_23g0012080 [Actinidia rufa]